jgi:hypothetical protein
MPCAGGFAVIKILEPPQLRHWLLQHFRRKLLFGRDRLGFDELYAPRFDSFV